MAEFPKAYYPLGLVGPGNVARMEFGYFSGLEGVLTTADVARKAAELRRAPYYILPQRSGRTSSRARADENLSSFRRASLFPLPLKLDPAAADIRANFADMLYENCRALAQTERLIVCASKDLTAPKS